MLTLDSPVFQELRRDFNEWLPAIQRGDDKFIPAHPRMADEPPAHWNPAISRIIAVVARKARCKTSDILGPNRSAVYSRPRAIAYLLVAEACPHTSHTEIASYFGGRDRTTVTHGINMAKEAIEGSEAWRDFFEDVKGSL